MDAGRAELLLKTAMKISISERNQGNEAYERIELPEPRSVRILFQFSRRGRRASVVDFLLRFSSRGKSFGSSGVNTPITNFKWTNELTTTINSEGERKAFITNKLHLPRTIKSGLLTLIIRRHRSTVEQQRTCNCDEKERWQTPIRGRGLDSCSTAEWRIWCWRYCPCIQTWKGPLWLFLRPKT